MNNHPTPTTPPPPPPRIPFPPQEFFAVYFSSKFILVFLKNTFNAISLNSRSSSPIVAFDIVQ